MIFKLRCKVCLYMIYPVILQVVVTGNLINDMVRLRYAISFCQLCDQSLKMFALVSGQITFNPDLFMNIVPPCLDSGGALHETTH